MHTKKEKKERKEDDLVSFKRK